MSVIRALVASRDGVLSGGEVTVYICLCSLAVFGVWLLLTPQSGVGGFAARFGGLF